MSSSVVAEAVKGELAERASGAGDAEQLELLPPTRFEEGTEARATFEERIARDRRGRPPGARNVRTEQAIAFVRRLIGDPLIESARYLAHTPETLAAELECSKLEAFQMLEKIRADLRTFIYPRMATVDAAGQAVPPTFVMSFGVAAAPARAGGELKPWEFRQRRPIQQIEQNQSLNENAPAKSHEEKSHAGANALISEAK